MLSLRSHYTSPRVADVNNRAFRTAQQGMPTLAIGMTTAKNRGAEESAHEAFARRLREAMLDEGYRAQKGAEHGVDVGPLMPVANVTRSAARKYIMGEALPSAQRIRDIADWLNVRVQWLRDGEEPKRAQPAHAGGPRVAQEVATYPSEATAFAELFLRLPPERRSQFRELVALAALISREPWLRMGHFDERETFDEYEHRIVREYKFHQRIPGRQRFSK